MDELELYSVFVPLNIQIKIYDKVMILRHPISENEYTLVVDRDDRHIHCIYLAGKLFCYNLPSQINMFLTDIEYLLK